MKTKTSYFIIFLLLLASVTPLAIMPTVSAQALTVQTDKYVYGPGETVVIFGTAAPGATIVVKVFDPDGIWVASLQTTAGATGHWSTSLKLPTSLPYGMYKKYGVYTVEASDGVRTASTTFEFRSIAVVTGVVVDENNKPLAGVKVYIEGTIFETTTGSDGKFTLSAEIGPATLVFDKPGYVTVMKELTIQTGENNVGTVQIKSFLSYIKELEDQIKALQQQLATVATKEDLEALRSELLSAIETAKSDMKSYVDTQIGTVNARVGGLEGRVNSLEGRMGSLEDRVSAVEALGTAVSDLRKTAEDLKTTVEELKGVTAQLPALYGISILGLIIAIVAVFLVYRKIAK